jgi:hypothetical protein
VYFNQDLSFARLRNGHVGVDLGGLAFDGDECFHGGGHFGFDVDWYGFCYLLVVQFVALPCQIAT